MKKPTVKVSEVRVRGYLCLACSIHNEIFGSDPAPVACLDCGGALALKPEYDIKVKSRKTTE